MAAGQGIPKTAALQAEQFVRQKAAGIAVRAHRTLDADAQAGLEAVDVAADQVEGDAASRRCVGIVGRRDGQTAQPQRLRRQQRYPSLSVIDIKRRKLCITWSEHD